MFKHPRFKDPYSLAHEILTDLYSLDKSWYSNDSAKIAQEELMEHGLNEKEAWQITMPLAELFEEHYKEDYEEEEEYEEEDL